MMCDSAEGIVEMAKTFTGIVRSRAIRVFLFNYNDEALPNVKCRVTFQDGQTTDVESNSEGIIEFIRKSQGEFEIEFLEEEAAVEESGEDEEEEAAVEESGEDEVL
jgi:hypothetical protein